jgi:hypothetical protein
MKEFNFRLKPHLDSGLRKSSYNRINQPALIEALNCELTEQGLIPYRSVKLINDTLKINPNVDSWPFPQIIRGINHTFVCWSDKIQLFNEEANTFQDIEFFDGYSTNDSASITKGGSWQLVDTANSWMLLNGTTVAFKPFNYRLFGDADEKSLIIGDIPIQTGAYSRGRVVLGGFEVGKSWNSAWRVLLAELAATAPNKLGIADMDLKSNFILWSGVGLDIFWLFYPEWMESGKSYELTGYSDEDKLLWHMIKRNDFGFMPMRWRGPVVRILELGEWLVVYGKYGITAIRPVTSPAPTYEVREISDSTGVMNRDAVCSSGDLHLFVSRDRELCTLTTDLKVSRLDYREYMNFVEPTKIRVNYDNKFERFFISDYQFSFVLNSKGLTRTRQLIASTVNYNGEPYAVYQSTGEDVMLVSTDTIDFGERGLKSIQKVTVTARSNEYLEVAVAYRFKSDEDFRQTDWVRVNQEGVAFVIITAVEFQILVKSVLQGKTNLDNITVSVKFGDRRYKRGINVESIDQ